MTPSAGLLGAMGGVALAIAAVSCSGERENPLASVQAEADRSRYIAYFPEADLSELGATDGEGADQWEQRGQEVVEGLRSAAEDAQADAMSMADEAGVEVHSSWVANAMIAEGGPELASALAELPGVELVAEEPAPPPGEGHDLQDVAEPEEMAWHLEAVGAGDAWEQASGDGVVVGVVDTGVDGSHPVLETRRASEVGGSDQAWPDWLDLVGDCSEPCDDAGHGTAAAGLVLGGGPVELGLAHGAAWMGVRACDDAGCELSDLFAATEWLLAPSAEPDQRDGDPALRPQVVSGSWGAPPGAPGYDRIVRAFEAAGMVVVLAAGNDGPTCGSIETPADQPEALAVGSVDRNGEIDPRSSRGPTGATDTRQEDGTPVKPDLVAPGVEVVTAGVGGGWVSASGTSFAAPIVAGAVALLLDGYPELIGNPAAVRELLVASAEPVTDRGCDGAVSAGGTVPAGDDAGAAAANQTYGAGSLDARGSLDRGGN